MKGKRMTTDGKYIIAVDFDGTLIHDNTWPDTEGTPDKVLIEHLIREKKTGNKIILNTCRTGEPLRAAVRFCEEHGLIFDAVNENLPELIEAYGSDCRKISADIYIDDHACHPESVSWSFLNEFGFSITNDARFRKGEYKHAE